MAEDTSIWSLFRRSLHQKTDQSAPEVTVEEVPDTASRWWWTSTETKEGEDPNLLATQPPLQGSGWTNPYARLAEYLNTPTQNSANDKQESTITSWFSWWTNPPEEEDAHTTLEHFREAKAAIENSRDKCHYAIKSVYGESEYELAVHETSTELAPVKYETKKRPLTPNEVQENVFVGMEPEELLGLSLRSRRLATVVPQVDDNLREITLRTKLRLVGEKALFQYKSLERHLYRVSEPRLQQRLDRIHNVVVIGVHGFLPIKLVRNLIGQSTGSSMRFVEHAAACIKLSIPKATIHTIALEGEGMIHDRVAKLLVILKNWQEVLASADYVMVVAHGLGVPVAVHLLEQMMHHFTLPHRINLLSMAGPFAGPFLGLDSKVVLRAYTSAENAIISELFELQRHLTVSERLHASMRFLANRNVKITLAAGVDDQIVPMYSALAFNLHHANIFRVLSCEKAAVPQFILTLLKIVLMVRNVGYSDHNLLRDLSERCQGSVGDQGGHAKIYDNDDVYHLAIVHSLSTTTLKQERDLVVETQPIGPHRSSGFSISMYDETLAQNMFHLPWNVRGMVNDLMKIKHLGNVALVEELLEDYNKWEPQKAWRDIKFCFQVFEDASVEDLLP